MAKRYQRVNQNPYIKEEQSLINNVSMNTCMGNTLFDHTAACITVFIYEIFIAVITFCEFFFSNNLWMYYFCSISLSLCIAVPNMVTFGGEECYKSGITRQILSSNTMFDWPLVFRCKTNLSPYPLHAQWCISPWCKTNNMHYIGLFLWQSMCKRPPIGSFRTNTFTYSNTALITLLPTKGHHVRLFFDIRILINPLISSN
jgi:hypothetical protein